jgi:transcriptional regulator with XRE-family HTH domain
MRGKSIKNLREGKKLSLEELSRTCNLPVSYLEEIEAEQRELTPKALDKLLSHPGLTGDLDAASLSTTGLGDKVRALRKEQGLSLEELGQALDLSFTYLSEIERGERVPSLQALQKISSFFHIPVSLLIGTPAKLMSTGKKIRMNRELRNLTQKQLAGAANVSPGLIAQLEAGKVQPSLKTIESLAKVLGVSVCYLILEQEDVEGIIGGISPELRELLYQPKAQMLIGNICTMDIDSIKLVLNFIGMLKNPTL